MLNISVLILSYNEDRNIGYTLDSVVGRFNQVIVVDSFSTDDTVTICNNYDSVEVYENEFTHWADQRNWILENCHIKNDWVFFLDSDESISDEFYLELKKLMSEVDDSRSKIASIYVRKDFFFLGKHLKYSYAHPYIKLLFDRRKNLKFVADGAREYASIGGDSLQMNSGLHHEDRRGFDVWVEKHVKNAHRESAQFFVEVNRGDIDHYNVSFKNKMKLFIRNKVWGKIPIGVRPFFYFIFRYFLQLGFLDGKVGFIFCVNHALWYQMLIDVIIIERQLEVDNERV